ESPSRPVRAGRSAARIRAQHQQAVPWQVHLHAQGLDAAQALLELLPRLQPAPARHQRSLAVQEFPDHGRRLTMDQKSLLRLAKTHGTPLFVVDHEALLKNYESFRKHLPRVQVYFAVKSNSDPAIIKTFHDIGASFDVASVAEFLAVHD